MSPERHSVPISDEDPHRPRREQAEPTEAAEAQECGGAEAVEEGGMVAIPSRRYEELKAKAEERDDYLDRLRRAVADYHNLVKRIERARREASKEALRRVMQEILPLADNLALALQAAEKAREPGQIIEGLRMLEKEFYGKLAALGITPIHAMGEQFDPHQHEAVMQEPVPAVEPNTVVRELKKGFMMGEDVIRPSQVAVAGPAAKQ